MAKQFTDKDKAQVKKWLSLGLSHREISEKFKAEGNPKSREAVTLLVGRMRGEEESKPSVDEERLKKEAGNTVKDVLKNALDPKVVKSDPVSVLRLKEQIAETQRVLMESTQSAVSKLNDQDLNPEEQFHARATIKSLGVASTALNQMTNTLRTTIGPITWDSVLLEPKRPLTESQKLHSRRMDREINELVNQL
ncbi:MAG: hypothetical protein HQL72_14035 [Magnetococcales bacterium]|nr:hypothetical protein [Magnetococcales bacterium]